MAGLLGALAALGNLGTQVGEADELNQQKETQAAAVRRQQQQQDAAAQERAQAAQLRRDEFAFKQQQANARRPLGTPFVGAGGKQYQRFYDPVTRTISEEPVGGAAPETDVEKYVRSLKLIGVTEEKAREMAAQKYGPAALKPGALDQKLAFWKQLGFSDAQIKRMAAVEGGLLPRPRILASGQGSGGPMTEAEVAAAAAERARGVQPTQQGLSKPENERVVKYMLDHGIHQSNKPTAQALNAAERGESILAIQKRIYKALDDPEITKYLGPTINPKTLFERSTGIGLPENVAEFRNDLISYGAFLAGLHPVRGIGALHYFDQVMGGMGQPINVLRGKLDSNRAVVESVNKAAKKDDGEDGGDDTDAQILAALDK